MFGLLASFDRKNAMHVSNSRFRRLAVLVLTCTTLGLLASGPALAKSAEQIDIEVNAALKEFKNKVNGADEFLSKAEGVLVFPKVIKAGIGIGGEYGEGALRIGGQTVDYYNTAGASIGLQLGGQARSQIIVFMAKDALDAFRTSSGWEAGVDGSIAVVEWGAGEDLSTVEVKDPIVAFIFGNKGLMFNISLEGSKFTKLDKSK
jgi:lipid-binding SYLF domain-containing protein